jgi:hypothetical protein
MVIQVVAVEVVVQTLLLRVQLLVQALLQAVFRFTQVQVVLAVKVVQQQP